MTRRERASTPVRPGFLALVFAIVAVACGASPEATPVSRPAPTASPQVSSSASPTVAEPTGYPETIADLALVVPRDAAAAASVQGFADIKRVAPALGEVLTGPLGGAVSARAGVPKVLLDRAIAEFDGATLFALKRGVGVKPDLGIVVRFKDAAVAIDLLAALGARKIDDVRYTGPGDTPIAFLEKARVVVVGSRVPVVEAALATLMKRRASFVESPLFPKSGAGGTWLAIDLGALVGEPDLFAEGSRLVASFSPKSSSIELDEYGSKVPRLGAVLAPTSHDLLARLPSGAAVAFGLGVERRPKKTLNDVVDELARLDDGSSTSLQSLLGGQGTNLTDLDRALGSEIAFGVYGGSSKKKSNPEEHFKETGGVFVAVGTRDEKVAGAIIDEIGHRQRKPKSAKVTPGKIELEITKQLLVRVERQQGAIVIVVGAKKAANELVSAFSSHKSPLGASAAFASYRKGAPAVSSLAMFVDATQFTALAPEARFPDGTTFGFDATLRPSDKGIELEIKGDGVVGVVGTASAVAIYGVQKYLSEVKTVEAKNTVGAIARGAVAGFEREGPNTSSRAPSHALCKSASPVPAAVPKRQTYAPSSEKGKDFDTGDDKGGWRCLKFSMPTPFYYRYDYRVGGGYKGPARGGPNPGPNGFEASAEGDLDGDGKTSLFTITGKVGPKGLVELSQLFSVDEDE